VNEMNNVLSNMRGTYSFDGVGYTINASNSANSKPLYRFYNMRTGTHFYTADEGEKNNVLNNMRSTYHLDGVAYYVSPEQVAGSTMVLRFYNMRTGTHFYTADNNEALRILNDMKGTYSLDGPAFYLAP
jgi:hypothetical protein